MTAEIDELDQIAEQRKFSKGTTSTRDYKRQKSARSELTVLEKIRRAQSSYATKKAKEK